MTTEIENEQQGDGEEAPEPEAVYAFDPHVIEVLGQSMATVIGERLCDAATMKLKDADALRTMTFKAMRKLFKDNCADQEGYLSPQQSLVETVVRMLLASKADRLTLSEIHADISDLWMTSPWPRHIDVESLQRVLDKSVAHGIVRVALS